MNTVEYLQLNSFTLSDQDKLNIKQLGRPLPDINITQISNSKNRPYNRHFRSEMYKLNSWICGCAVKNALFCFPCLLFGNASEERWTKTGVRDLIHLSTKIKRHQSSQSHLTCQFDFALLREKDLQLHHRSNVQAHNDGVINNRYILTNIINAILFCAKYELPFRGHGESENSVNCGVFRGLIKFSAELDSALNSPLEPLTTFHGALEDIYNEIIDCILAVCRQEIVNEIGDNAVSLMADEVTDVSTSKQIVIVLRYVINLQPVERFWTFLNPEFNDAKSLAEEIKGVLKTVVKDPKKLISQSFDGTPALSGGKGRVQKLIKDDYPNADIVNCYTHQLTSVLIQAISENSLVRMFFMNLSAFSTFFTQSPQHTAILDEIVKRNLLRLALFRWNFQSKTVSTVYENKQTLIECFQKISFTSKQATTVNQALALLKYLEDENFNYWLEIFNMLMPHVDMLQELLQKSPAAAHVEKAVLDFKAAILEIKEKKIETIALPQLPQRTNIYALISSADAAKEVCDVFVSQVERRLNFTRHLSVAAMLDSRNFQKCHETFPYAKFKHALKYIWIVHAQGDDNRIKSELQLLFYKSEFRNIGGAVQLLNYITSNELTDIFQEVTKLARIVCTIPMITSEAERCFTTLKGIKTFLKNTTEKDKLTALAMISTEREMISKLPSFVESVIDEFSSRTERKDFQYRDLLQDVGGTMTASQPIPASIVWKLSFPTRDGKPGETLRCNSLEKLEEELVMRLRNLQNASRLKCQACWRMFVTEPKYLQHILVCPQQCPTCGDFFATMEELSKHIVGHQKARE